MPSIDHEPLFLIIDAGSSSVRVALFDQHLRECAIESIPHQFDATPDGGVTVDPDWLRGNVETCIDRALARLCTPESPLHGATIEAVGCSSFVGNVLGVDAAGRPVTPVSTYADTRALSTLERLRQTIDTAAAAARTGSPMHTAYHPARLRWMIDHGARPDRWVDFLTYCYRAWFGRVTPCSYSLASWSGLLNRATLTWDAAWLETLGLTSGNFPPLAEMNAVQVGLAPVYAARWPELAEVAFYLPIGDGAGANVGVGAVHGEIALSIGTTAALRAVFTEPVGTEARPPTVPPGLWGYRITAPQHLIGGAISDAGSVFAWARRMFQDVESAEQGLLARPADAHGLLFLPFLSGERSPGYRADATGSFHGLRLSTTPADLLQAALEGVAMRLALVANLLDPTGKQPIYASGGALTRSPAWQQITADALNRPLVLFAGIEASARGTAALVRRFQHGTRVETDAATPDALLEPRPAFAEALQAARAEQERLYGRLWTD